MRKSDLIDALGNETNITKDRAEHIVKCIFDPITEALQNEKGVEIRGLSSFTVRHYPQLPIP